MSPATAAPAPAPFVEQLIPIDQLHESRTNPRRTFDPTAIDELAASIGVVGLLEPLLVRQNAKGFEVVAGARRLRAARIAGLAAVPCRVRAFTDKEALEVQIIENLQRQDVHPLDEADGYAALQKADKAYTPEAIAARVGRTPAYVKGRLKFRDLGTDARKAFADERITAGHAAILVKVPPALQKQALDACFYRLLREDDGESGRALQPVRALHEWYRHHVVLDVQAPETRELFPEIAQRHDAGATLVPITHAYYLDASVKKQFRTPPLTSGEWQKVEKKQRCEHVQTGVVIVGHGRAEVFEICAHKKCATHWPWLNRPASSPTATPERKRKPTTWELQQQRERQLAAKLSKVKVSASQQLLAKLEGKPLTAEAVKWLVEQARPAVFMGSLESVLGPSKTWTPARATQLLLWCFTLRGSYNLGRLGIALKKGGVDAVKLAAEAKKAKAGAGTPHPLKAGTRRKAQARTARKGTTR